MEGAQNSHTNRPSFFDVPRWFVTFDILSVEVALMEGVNRHTILFVSIHLVIAYVICSKLLRQNYSNLSGCKYRVILCKSVLDSAHIYLDICCTGCPGISYAMGSSILSHFIRCVR